MKERPILFSGPMVRAILAGKKTQTRRVIEPPRWADPSHSIQFIDGWPVFAHRKTGKIRAVKCPYGVPGDRLWVRERHGFPATKASVIQATDEHGAARVVCYHADVSSCWIDEGEPGPTHLMDNTEYHWIEGVKKWRPSIHMPRWASRINRDITEIRVELLNDISEEDAIAEGCESTAVLTADGKDYTGLYAKEHYAALWDEINGVGSWQTNPLVWVVSFTEAK